MDDEPGIISMYYEDTAIEIGKGRLMEQRRLLHKGACQFRGT